MTSERIPILLALSATAVACLAAAGLAVGVAVPLVAWTALLLTLLAALAWIDARTRTVPDVLTLALVICGLAYAFASGLPIRVHLLIAALLIAAGLLHARATGDKGWIGSGDFFLVAGVVAWVGPVLVIDVLALTSILLLAHGIVARRSSIALAPSLAISASIIWLGGPLL